MKFTRSEKLKLVDRIAYQENAIVSSEIVKNPSGRIVVFAFDEGEELSEHTAPFEAFVTIIDGAATISIAGEQHELETGESILMPANIPHAVKANGRFKMVLNMIRA
ncbi:MAG: cupin domain-containing protein [Puniceicoccaceae bacterium]